MQQFLAHNTCTKDIVRMENNYGETAEIMANSNGNHECARLVREYLENNDDTAGDRNSFVIACMDNKVRKVRRMISKGVDNNGEDSDGATGLMWAMRCGSTEVVRILLGSNNIKIDTKDSITGNTALHFACNNNRVECVELFLTHNTCTKDIVRMKSDGGYTAEMMARISGKLECARLIDDALDLAR